MANLPLLLALLLYLGGQRFLVRRSLQSAAFLTINLSFGFWYWLPAVQLLNFPPPELSIANITPEAIEAAAWFVLVCHFVTVVLFLAAKDLFDREPLGSLPPPPLPALGIVLLLSSLLAFVVTFRDLGVDQMLRILTGRDSAREVMTFYNRSSGAGESLLSLWQIINISVAVFVLVVCAARRQVASFSGSLAGLALGLCFLGSGTRTILLQALLAALLAFTLRPASRSERWMLLIERSRLRFLYLGLMAVVGAVAFYAIAARFALTGVTDASYVTDSIVNNNDMMRELAFVFENMSNYQASDAFAEALSYARTPFNTILPSFLGFDKPIPYHLLLFNQFRAGIDLENGQGNVFPGVVADFWLVFGPIAGPVALAVFVLAALLAMQAISRTVRDGTYRVGLFVLSLTLLFASFRNVQGSFVMTLIALPALVWLFEQLVAIRRGGAGSAPRVAPRRRPA